MTKSDFSDSELLILGLIAEMPRYGYELEGIIKERSMREWTRIGFSSIYYTLGKLEKKGLVAAGEQTGPKTRKGYKLTDQGKRVLIENTYSALKDFQPTYPSLLVGMIHLPALSRDQTLDALRLRQAALAEEIKRLEDIHFSQQPLPDHVDLVFDYSLDQLKAEDSWIEKTLIYLETKTWLE
jgi:DNA-binding PadR family transcriptional regulator